MNVSELNALVRISQVLRPDSQSVLRQTHQKILDDRYVKQEGIRVDLAQLRQFYQAVRLGMVYAQATWGRVALPAYFILGPEIIIRGQVKIYQVVYHSVENKGQLDKDEILMTRLYAAKHMDHFGDQWVINNDWLSPGLGVLAEDHITLVTIEECYHRYQVHGRGQQYGTVIGSFDPQGHRADPFEIELRPVMAQAIKDLAISLFKLRTPEKAPEKTLEDPGPNPG